MILDVEPVGAMRVKEIYPQATLIYIAPPSLEALEQRLRARNDTPEEQIKIRQQRAAWEDSQKDKYDYIVINDVLDDAVATVVGIISQNTKD
jgi:guanylate kinase